MTALGIEFSSREPDVFVIPKHSFRGKPMPLLEVEGRIADLEAEFIRLTDRESQPWDELDEITDQICQLEKLKWRIWDEWQFQLNNQRKEQVQK